MTTIRLIRTAWGYRTANGFRIEPDYPVSRRRHGRELRTRAGWVVVTPQRHRTPVLTLAEAREVIAGGRHR